MKIRYFVFIIIIIALGVFTYWLFNQKIVETPVTTVATTTPVQVGKISFTTKSITDTNAGLGYAITAEYPEVAGMTDKTVQRLINKQLADKVASLIDDFKKSTQDDRVNNTNPQGDEQSTFDVIFTDQQHSLLPNVLSFKFSESYFEAGAAHPGQSIETFNFDVKTGKALTFDDLFVSGSDYLDVLSIYSIAQLKRTLGDSEQISQGAGPDADNFAAFLLTNDGIKIIFNQYQVAAYAAGVQEVTVPYSELKADIKKDGILGPLISQ